jgi:hypothetical protein
VTTTAPRRPPKWLKYANRLNVAMLRRGIGPGPQWVLSIPGRASGVARSTPVAILQTSGHRYLVAGYETSDWVKNARAAMAASIQRGKRIERVRLTELPVDESPPILREFSKHVRGGRSFMPVAPNGSDAEFSKAALHHPVFRLDPIATPLTASGP